MLESNGVPGQQTLEKYLAYYLAGTVIPPRGAIKGLQEPFLIDDVRALRSTDFAEQHAHCVVIGDSVLVRVLGRCLRNRGRTWACLSCVGGLTIASEAFTSPSSHLSAS